MSAETGAPFVVQTKAGGKWTTAARCQGEAEARKAFDRLVSPPALEHTRIIVAAGFNKEKGKMAYKLVTEVDPSTETVSDANEAGAQRSEISFRGLREAAWKVPLAFFLICVGVPGIMFTYSSIKEGVKGIFEGQSSSGVMNDGLPRHPFTYSLSDEELSDVMVCAIAVFIDDPEARRLSDFWKEQKFSAKLDLSEGLRIKRNMDRMKTLGENAAFGRYYLGNGVFVKDAANKKCREISTKYLD